MCWRGKQQAVIEPAAGGQSRVENSHPRVPILATSHPAYPSACGQVVLAQGQLCAKGRGPHKRLLGKALQESPRTAVSTDDLRPLPKGGVFLLPAATSAHVSQDVGCVCVCRTVDDLRPPGPQGNMAPNTLPGMRRKAWEMSRTPPSPVPTVTQSGKDTPEILVLREER